MKRQPKRSIISRIPILRSILRPFHEKKLKKRWLNYVWGDVDRPVKEGMVNVYYFKWHGEDNVGDLLSLIIVDLVREKFSLHDIKKDKTIRLFAIGSVIHAAMSDMVVWGSGIRNFKANPPHFNFDIRAVRGPMTKKKMRDAGYECPEVYGDPALLLPLFYNPVIAKKYDYIIIPHYYKEDDVPVQYLDKVVSTFTSDWKAFIDTIIASEYVISSSLHGLILAEAYGIPAILYDVESDKFKYEDYYQGTGRTDIPIADSLEFAIKHRLTTTPIPNLGKIQKDLLDSFPKDLWLQEIPLKN